MPINVENLRKLAQANRESKHVLRMNSYFAKSSCGTACCVIGNYALREDLQSFMKIVPTRMSPLHMASGELIEYDEPLVLEHFGISKREAIELFDPCLSLCAATSVVSECTTPQEAADYIERFIERKLKKEGRE